MPTTAACCFLALRGAKVALDIARGLHYLHRWHAAAAAPAAQTACTMSVGHLACMHPTTVHLCALEFTHPTTVHLCALELAAGWPGRVLSLCLLSPLPALPALAAACGSPTLT